MAWSRIVLTYAATDWTFYLEEPLNALNEGLSFWGFVFPVDRAPDIPLVHFIEMFITVGVGNVLRRVCHVVGGLFAGSAMPLEPQLQVPRQPRLPFVCAVGTEEALPARAAAFGTVSAPPRAGPSACKTGRESDSPALRPQESAVPRFRLGRPQKRDQPSVDACEGHAHPWAWKVMVICKTQCGSYMRLSRQSAQGGGGVESVQQCRGMAWA